MKFLRQTTAVIADVGPILGTDFLTPQTAAVLVTTRAELFKAAATTAVDISGRTFTHISGGVYQLALLTSDVDTVGPLMIHIHLAGATPLLVPANVLSARAYDTLCGGGNLPADVLAIFGSATAATNLSNGALATLKITVQNGASVNLIPTDLTNAVSSFYNGRTLVFITGVLAGQACSITAYNGATKQLSTSALTGAPSVGDTAVIV